MSDTAAAAGAPPRIAYTVREVACSVGVDKRHIYRLIEKGEIPSFRLGARVLVPAEDFHDLVKKLIDDGDGHA